MAATIHVVNQSTAVSDDELAAVLPAFQKHADLVTDAWALAPVTLKLTKSDARTYGELVRSARRQIILRDNTDQANGELGNNLGYQYATPPGGFPLAFLFVKAAIRLGFPWTVVFTHELAESLANPLGRNVVEVRRRKPGLVFPPHFYSKSICDPVQSGETAFEIDGVLCSNFVTPAWFCSTGAGPYDYLGLLNGPLRVLPGGHAEFYVPELQRYQQVRFEHQRERPSLNHEGEETAPIEHY
jgi:hypothetical protein